MRPKELIPILAEKFGVSFETAWVLDRALADQNLRTKSKGRKPLDMTRRDAIHFLLACMSASISTRAVEDVKYWAAFNWVMVDPDCKEYGSAKEVETAHSAAALGHMPGANPPADEPAYKEYPMGYKAEMHDPLVKLADDDGIITLVDYLLVLTRWLQISGPEPDQVRFEIVTTHDLAFVRYEKPLVGEIHTDHFFCSTISRGSVDELTGIHKGAYVYGWALLEIADRTTDPLDKVLA